MTAYFLGFAFLFIFQFFSQDQFHLGVRLISNYFLIFLVEDGFLSVLD